MQRALNRTRRWAGIITGTFMSLLVIATVGAESTQIVQSITGGGQPTIGIDSVSLAPASYSPDEQYSPGQLGYIVDAETGTSDGWSVNVQASDFTYSGTNDGTDIPAANLAITTANSPGHVSGDAVDVNAGPSVPEGATGSLDQPRTVLVADAGYGHGVYQQALDLVLTIPGDSKVGDYSGTITFTATTGP